MTFDLSPVTSSRRNRYRRRFIALIAFVTLLRMFTSDVHSEPELPVGSMPESGQKLYERSCASCHGKGARGDGPAAASLKTPPPDLTQIAKRRNGQFPAGDIATYIDGRLEISAHGSREMPIWGDSFSDSVGGGSIGDEVTRGNVAVIVEYLKSIQR